MQIKKKRKGKIITYNYPNSVQDLSKIDKKIKEDITNFCKKHRINKSKLIEEFYKTILLRWRDGSLSVSNGYITMNILREPITKVRSFS
mgnify:CR=1 FL=1